MAADFYILLNVSRRADPDEIRRAYRGLLARLRPEDLIELRAAFEILTDPSLRAAYDRELAHDGGSRPFPPPFTGNGPSTRRNLLQPVHLFDSFHTHRPAADHLYRLIAQNFISQLLHAPKSQPKHPVHVDVILDPAQARAGGSLPLHIPLPEVCQRCSGTGRTGSAACDLCVGDGSTWSDHQLDVLIPSNTRDGTTVPVPLSPLGIRNLHLVLHLRVAHGSA
jgi:molecular chaperone DnaJ